MRASALFACVVMSGCASLSPEVGHDQVATLIKQRTGEETGWRDGPPEPQQVAARVNALLDGGLNAQNVVAVALLNSPSLRVSYEALGISQADMVQAGLLRNPTFSVALGVPLGPGTIWEQQFSIVQDFLDLFVLPLRKDVAAQQFAADVSRVAGEAYRTAAEASEALIDVQTAVQRLEVRRSLFESAELSATLAERQFEAGNIAEAERTTQLAQRAQARLAVINAEQDVIRAREAVNRALGLFGTQTQWVPAPGLGEPPPTDPDLSHIEARAIEQRLDVEAARRQLALFERALTLTKTWRWLGRLEIGVDTHLDPNGPRLLGPSLVIELPIFDQRQAAIARLEAQVRQSVARLDWVSITARSEVRQAVASMIAARARVEAYRSTLVPLRAQAVELTQRNYNAMQVGLYGLLAVKQQHLDAVEGSLDALRDYWHARIELNAAVGANLDDRPNAGEQHEH